MIDSGEKDAGKVLGAVKEMIHCEPMASIDYAELYSFPELEEFNGPVQGQVFIALAVKFGTTRLIDNIIIEVK